MTHNSYPLSDRQLENFRAVFSRGVKKRNGPRLAGNPVVYVNTLASEFWVSLRMVWGKIRFIPFRPNSVLYAFFRPGQSMLKFFVSSGQSTPITLFYSLDGHRIWGDRREMVIIMTSIALTTSYVNQNIDDCHDDNDINDNNNDIDIMVIIAITKTIVILVIILYGGGGGDRPYNYLF